MNDRNTTASKTNALLESWLLTAIQMAEPVTGHPTVGYRDFMRTCLNAAEVSFEEARAQQAAAQLGFLPLAVTDYVKAIEESLGTDHPSTGGEQKICLPAALDAAFARGWADFARRLRLPVRQALAHLRLSVIGEVDTSPVLLTAAQRNGDAPEVNDLVEFDRCWEERLRSWKSDSINFAKDLERAFMDAYRVDDNA